MIIPMCQGFSNFLPHFVLAKLATSSIRVKLGPLILTVRYHHHKTRAKLTETSSYSPCLLCVRKGNPSRHLIDMESIKAFLFIFVAGEISELNRHSFTL